MTKAVIISLGFILLLTAVTPAHAQTSPIEDASNQAILRQANRIVLRQKLVNARAAVTRGELVEGAKLYQEAADLAQQVGSGIDLETAEAISGLATTRLTLARQAQAQHDFNEADKQIIQVLKYDPKNAEALDLKKRNEQFIAFYKGKMPDAATLEQIPVVNNAKVQAGTLVQDGKLLYEMGKLEEAQAKLQAAVKIDPDNSAAFYYINLIQQAQFSRSAFNHVSDTQIRMQKVEKEWVLPQSSPPYPNAYALTNLVYTGPGRQEIVGKLDRIHLDSVDYEGLPLSEVLKDLAKQAAVRDPEKTGINFLINNNENHSDRITATPNAGGGFPGGRQAPGPTALDPNTGAPLNAPA